jgi:ABC-type sugar transport system substrate-binding protein
MGQPPTSELKGDQIMKGSISTLTAVLACMLALAGLAAPSAAQQWYDSRTANELPVGSTPWWHAMDREGRGGSGGN